MIYHCGILLIKTVVQNKINLLTTHPKNTIPMDNIYLHHDDQQIGPFTEEKIRRYLEEGRIQPTTLAWVEGAVDWKPISEMLGLAATPPATTPPPLQNVPAVPPPPIQSSESVEMKACQFCGEQILRVAQKCKHCGSDLSGSKANAATTKDNYEELAKIIRSCSPNSKQIGKRLYLLDAITAQAVAKAKSKYAQAISPTERPVILYEFTGLFDLWMCGFVLTDRNFYYFGIDDYKSPRSGSRLGVIPLGQIRGLFFKESGLLEGWDHFIVNGMGPEQSRLIPKFFELKDNERELLNQIFVALQPIFDELASGAATANPGQFLASGAGMPQSAASNPLLAAPEAKPGCFKSGCGLIIGLILLGVGLLALLGGLGFLG